MTDEDRLRDRLRDQAANVPIVSDLDDVAVRIGRRERNHTRPLAAAAVGVLVVAALVAVVAERAGRDTPHVRVASEGDAPVVPATTLPVGVVTGVLGVTGPTGAPGGPGPTSPFSPAPTGPTGADGGTGASSGPPPVSSYLDVPTTTLPVNSLSPTVAQPKLPEPGPEQPADPAAARQEVTQALVDAMSGDASNEKHAAAIEGGPAMLDLFQQLRTGSSGKAVNEAKTEVLGIVFLSPTRATTEFRANLGADGFSGPYVGDVIVTQHGWQVAREFYCRLIALAGVNCP